MEAALIVERVKKGKAAEAYTFFATRTSSPMAACARMRSGFHHRNEPSSTAARVA